MSGRLGGGGVGREGSDPELLEPGLVVEIELAE